MTDAAISAHDLIAHQTNAVRIVEAYWHRQAAAKGVPRRLDMHPGAMLDALEYAFIGERVTGRLVRFRVTGDTVSTLLGRSAKGQMLSDLIAPDTKPAFAKAVEAVFTQPAKATLILSSKHAEARATLRLYPLKDPYDHIRQVIGTVVTHGVSEKGLAPFRLVNVALTPFHPVRTDQLPALASRGHLKLVVSKSKRRVQDPPLSETLQGN